MRQSNLLIEQATTTGDDRIFGFYRSDELDGGLGDDFLSGGDDGDIYRWGKGVGNDTIEDRLTDQNTEARRDSLELGGGLRPTDVTFTRSGRSDDLTLTIVETGETLSIIDQFQTLHSGPFGQRWFDRIEDFIFSDSSRLDWEDVMLRVLAGARTDGDDDIYGFDHDDVIDGGAGNDRLFGLGGNDVYVFGRGYGHDTIDEDVSELLLGQFDIVRFTSDVAIDDIRLVRGLSQADLDIEILGTADVLSIKGAFFNASSLAINFVEELHFADGSVLDLEEIKARLIASEKTAGDDLVRGFDDRADVLDGGPGNDRLEGYNGSDTYIFDRGSGHDVVLDKGTILGGGADDAIAFGPAILPSDIRLERQNDDLLVRIAGAADTLLIENMFYQAFEWYRIERFSFADGTSWSFAEIQERLLIGTSGNDTLDGFNRPDILDGGPGNDLLTGRDGNDTYHFGLGYGHDTIHDRVYGAGASNFDTVVFGSGIAPQDLAFTSQGNDLKVTLPSGESLTILQQLKSSPPFNRIEEFRFADGTIWDLARILASAGNLSGTSGDDILIGGNGKERIEGLQGDDRLEGGRGGDTYIYSRGDGNDVIYDSGVGAPTDVDRIYFGEGIAPGDVLVLRVPTGTADENDIVLEIGGSVPGSITIENQLALASGLYGIEEIVFADGTGWTRPDIEARAYYRTTEGDDDIRAGNDANEISGRGGNDILQGNGGTDTLHGNAGDDTLRGNGQADTLHGDEGDDILDGGDGDDLLFGGDGDDLLIGGNGADSVYGGSGDDVFIHGAGADLYDGGAGVDTVDYSSSTGMRTIDLTAGVGEDTLVGIEIIITGAGADQLTGDAAANHFISNGGADILRGEGGNDLLQGGSGADQLFGGDGDDRLEGGDGNDQLRGEAGDDWLRGDLGVDTFDGGSGIDTLDLSHNADARSITMVAGAGVTESGESFTGIENILTGGGDDTIVGDAEANLLSGGDGGDMLEGGGGDDILDGGSNTDFARFSGQLSDYRITTLGGGDLRVADLRAGGDGTDTLISIEFLTFADITKRYADVVNRPPGGLLLSAATLSEQATGGAVVGLLSAIDPNGPGDLAGFSLVEETASLFEVVGQELRLKAAARLDHEVQPTHSLTIRVADWSGATFDQTFTIAVTDANEAPTGVLVSGGTIAEDASARTVAATLSAIDPDLADTATFILAASYAGPFEIVDNAVRLREGATLDAESNAVELVEIIVADAGGLELATTIAVTVTDANEPPSSLLVTLVPVAENAPSGSLVARLAATDPDAGDHFTYSLPAGYLGPFQVVGDELRLKEAAHLNYETAPQHEVIITTHDAAGLSRSDTVVVTILDVNEAPTGLNVTGAVVSEAMTPGSLVATLAGIDPDAGDTLRYALPANYAGPFEILGNEIRLRSDARLDAVEQPTHELDVRVEDAGGLSITIQIVIALTAGPDGGGGNAPPIVLTGDGAANILRGRAGDDLIRGGGGDDMLIGNRGGDHLVGGRGDDLIRGGPGDDDLRGDAGADRIYGGTGNDTARGGAGDDTIRGEAGDDLLIGNGGRDRAFGGAGSDQILGGAGDDELWGGGDGDVILGGQGADALHGGAGDDELHGNSGSDRLDGGAGADNLNGGAGNDLLIGGSGNDTILTGAGFDTVCFTRNSGSDIVLDFADGLDTLKVTGLSARALSIMSVAEGTLVIAGSSQVLLVGMTPQQLIDDIAFS